LLPVDLQWFGMRILTQKFALFGFLKVEGKKMVLEVWTDGFCTKTTTLRYLRCAWAIWTWLQGASVLCWGKSRNLKKIVLPTYIFVRGAECLQWVKPYENPYYSKRKSSVFLRGIRRFCPLQKPDLFHGFISEGFCPYVRRRRQFISGVVAFTLINLYTNYRD